MINKNSKYIISEFSTAEEGFHLIKESYKRSEVTGGEWLEHLIFTNTPYRLIQEAVSKFRNWDIEDDESFFPFLRS